MGNSAATPVPFAAVGLYDTLDGTNSPPGAMSSLMNLLPDRGTQQAWNCRPAATQSLSFFGFTTPGNVSALLTVGSRVYGMVGSGLNAGKDQPFCYDYSTSSYITISGITSANTPTTQVTTGDWTPPQMVQVAQKIIITHPGYNGSGSNFFGVIDVTTPATPAYSSSNTTGNSLPSVPTFVAQYYNRAWFACGNKSYYSDVLAPLSITNASQFLTLGDTSIITAMSNQSSDTTTGGQSQSLTILKANIIYQITGDAALNNLLDTPLRGAVGTIAPSTVANTPLGTMFMAVDGVRIVDSSGSISSPVPGIQLPFIFALYPSRASASYNNDVYRISVNNGNISGAPFQEYFYRLDLQQWSGPHTFPSHVSTPYSGTFLVAVNGIVGVWQSDVVQSLTSTFVENGTALSWAWQTAPFIDTNMNVKNIFETTIDLAFQGSSISVNALVLDSNNTTLNSYVVYAPPSSGAIWGAFLWGNANWGASQVGFKRYTLNWNAPVVTEKFAFLLNGSSVAGFKIGDLWTMVENLGYVNI